MSYKRHAPHPEQTKGLCVDRWCMVWKREIERGFEDARRKAVSDVMLFGVLRMPPACWLDSEIDKAQRHSRYVEAADRIESLESRLAAAEKALKTVYDALCSDPPDHGAQKEVYSDNVVYRLDGQLMYQAINLVRNALNSSEKPTC